MKMMSNIEYKLYHKDENIEDNLSIILKETDADFQPRLTEKYKIEEIIDKFVKLSHCIISFVNGEPAGLVVFYPNEKPKDSYLSIICVREKFRGLKIGITLEEKCLNYCKNQKSRGLRLNMRKSNNKLFNSRINLGYIVEKEYMSVIGNEIIVDLYKEF